MVRRTMIALAASTMLLGGTLSAAPAATAAIPIDNSIGKAWAPNQVRQGHCGRYKINWRFNPPSPEWSAVVQIRGPKGRKIHHLLYDAGADATRGSERITLCGSSYKAGRFKMQTTMVYNEGRDEFRRRSDPTYFRILPRR
jgi:hypothetical protein